MLQPSILIIFTETVIIGVLFTVEREYSQLKNLIYDPTIRTWSGPNDTSWAWAEFKMGLHCPLIR